MRFAAFALLLSSTASPFTGMRDTQVMTACVLDSASAPRDLRRFQTFGACLSQNADACMWRGLSGIKTFTRATVASHMSAATGLRVKDASGVPRFEQNGYLSEGARTNKILRAEELDTAANWVTVNASVAADSD